MLSEPLSAGKWSVAVHESRTCIPSLFVHDRGAIGQRPCGGHEPADIETQLA